MTIPASLLEEIKAWLGVSGNADDAWLTRQAEIVLAAMRSVTGRWLYPQSECIDVFQAPQDPCGGCAPSCGCGSPCPPVEVAVLPAGELISISQGNVALSPTDYLLTKRGELRTTADRRPVPVPATGWLTLVYQGGFAELPADLLDALLNLVGAAWEAAGKGASPGQPIGMGRVQIADVGSVDMPVPEAPGLPADPILGPYTALMAPYVTIAGQVGAHPCRESDVGEMVA